MKLLGKNASYKVAKGQGFGYDTYIMYLAPSTLSGWNTCAKASEGCAKACLFSSGRGAQTQVRNARLRKTEMYFQNRGEFMRQLEHELTGIVERRRSKNPVAVRLNGTSDLAWTTVIRKFPNLQFYDYTKRVAIVKASQGIDNYNVTFSRSESNQRDVETVLQGYPETNVAVVFDELPDEYLGREVIDGDETDLRFLGRSGVIVGLTPKGKAGRVDESGFVVRHA